MSGPLRGDFFDSHCIFGEHMDKSLRVTFCAILLIILDTQCPKKVDAVDNCYKN